MRLLQEWSKIPLGFGTAAISGEGGGYGFGDMPEEKALSLLGDAFERGIVVYDTAPIYGFGLAERRLGKAFKGKRDKVKFISKCGITWHSTKRVDMTNDPGVAEKMLEQSLRDLQSEYIDLYMIHWPDPRVDIRRPMEVLAKAKNEGKIQAIGLCNTNLSDLALAREVADVSAVQSQLNLFQREVLEELLPTLVRQNISFMSWGTLDKGVLTGSVTKNRKFDASDARSWARWWKQSNYPQKMEKMEQVFPLLKKKNVDPESMCLGFNLSHEGVDMVLCGPKSVEQMDVLFRSLESIPDEQAIIELQALYEL